MNGLMIGQTELAGDELVALLVEPLPMVERGGALVVDPRTQLLKYAAVHEDEGTVFSEQPSDDEQRDEHGHGVHVSSIFLGVRCHRLAENDNRDFQHERKKIHQFVNFVNLSVLPDVKSNPRPIRCPK